MGLFTWLTKPNNASQSASAGESVNGPDDLERVVRTALVGTSSGQSVTPETSMQVGAVFGCVRLISGAVANLPAHVKRRVDDHIREELADHPLSIVLRRRPNGWQTPSQFKRMMQVHLLLRGNAYAQIVRSRGRVIALHPMHPDQMTVRQLDDLTLVYEYRRSNGTTVVLPSDAVMHLVGLTLDGVRGVSVITYARETIGLSMAQEKHGSTTFKNGARPSSILTHPEKIGPDAQANLRASLEEYRSGGSSEGKTLIVEEGMTFAAMSVTAEDAQWIESRKFSRSDIAMFFGVPPHMIGDTEKSTSWGSGIEQQSIGFVTYTLEDHFTTWEETIARDLIDDGDSDIYVRFNRKALVRGDIKTRTESYVRGLQWGWMSPNEVRQLEDMNPRDGGEIYYEPPNTAGKPQGEEGDSNDNS